jgi:hypothetical protein
MFELQAASRNPGVVLLANFQRDVLGQKIARFGNPASSAQDLPRKDNGLGARAAFG